MALFTRRPRLDDAAIAALALGPRERVLAFQCVDTITLVATTFRLLVLDDSVLVFERPWHGVDTIVWDRDTSILRITWVDETRPWAFEAPEPDEDLMTTMRARVQSTLVTSQSAKVAGRSVRIVLRKDLRTDELFLQHQYAQGLRADTPGVAATVARLEAQLRDDAGLPPSWAGAEPA